LRGVFKKNSVIRVKSNILDLPNFFGSPHIFGLAMPLVTARFNILFKSINVTKTINIFLAHFRFLKKKQIFLMLLGIMLAAPPAPKSPLISSNQQQKHLAYN